MPTIAHITDLLETGHEDTASAEIQRVLAADPGNRAAQSLQRQITEDPASFIGQDTVPYTVRPGDNMSNLARRFLGDSQLFYVLARYNDIKVPRQLAVGQTIKVPASERLGPSPPPAAPPVVQQPAPPPVTATPLPPTTPPPAVATAPTALESKFDKAMHLGQEAEAAKNYEKAYGAYQLAAQLDPTSAEAKAKVEEVRRELVNQYTYTARSAFAKQDLDGAINYWDRVLGLDPSNETAKLERQKTISLRDKFKAIN